MRALRTTLLICFLSLSAVHAWSDQLDPRLDELFAELNQASRPDQAGPIAQKIWAIWHETPDRVVQSLLSSGIGSMSQGDLAGALKTFDQIVAIAPNFSEAWNKRATVHFLMNNLDQSLQDIVKTLELEPRHFGALSGRGLVYVKLEDFERALVAFEAALAVNPQMTGQEDPEGTAP